MNAMISLLAQPLVPDVIWFVLLWKFLPLMHSLGSLRDRADAAAGMELVTGCRS